MPKIEILTVTAKIVTYLLDGEQLAKTKAEFEAAYPPTMYGRPQAGAKWERPAASALTLTRRWRARR